MFIGNLVLLILNLPLIPYIAKVLSVPRNYLIPFILFFTLMGAYIGQNNATELLILVGFGVCATALKFADYPLAPLLIGFILGGMMEDNFSRSMQLYDGIAFIWERPMTLGLLVIAALLVLHERAETRVLEAMTVGGQAPPARLMVGPVPADPLSWDVVAARDGQIEHGRFSWREGARLRVGRLALSGRAFAQAELQPAWREIEAVTRISGFLAWVRFPWLAVRPTESGAREVSVMDARYVRDVAAGFGTVKVELPAR